MNKKLIAVALAALPVAHAMADVTIYGTIAADIQNGKTYDGQASAGKKSATRIDDAGSSIGFKGTEDLGNGLKAIWQVEQGLNIDGTSGTTSANGYSGNLATRDSFVGLQGAFGKVRLGRLSTFQNSDTETYDAWTYAGSNDKTVAGMTYMSGNQLDGRHNNAIRYDLPEVVSGLSGAVLYSTDEARKVNDGVRSNTQFWSVGAAYTNSGYFVNGGYNRFGDEFQKADGSYKSGNYWRLEAGYNANNILASVFYGQSKLSTATDGTFSSFATTGDSLASGDLKKKEAGFTVGYTIGAITPKFSYGRVWGANVTSAAGVETDVSGHLNQYVLGADYALSKRTTAFAAYGYVQNSYVDQNNNKYSNEHTVAVGVQHKF